ncbi:lipopolysaccharide biosynthesis protein [Heyndrickxia coagulans]|uniref:lipopolysaccharide biosynthesis protein n=1 Tax=Heyndrickxia coagulans TaxID=1398 RepID=UPI001A93FC74|nr:oligosaccharide flippase family protein [Heyndrickxia coagulans]
MRMVNRSNNKALKSITSLGSATLLNAILAFLVEIINRNILGPEKYGYWLSVSLIFTFVPLFQLGTLNAMNREVPFYLARKEFEKVKEIRETVFSFIYSIPLSLMVLLFVVSLFLFMSNIHYEYKTGLMFASVIGFFTYLSGYAEMYYKSEQNFSKASKLISIKSISQSIITVIMVSFFGYLGLYIGMLLALLIEISTARITIPRIKKKHSFAEYKDLINIGFPILLVGMVWNVMIATDRIIISLFMSPKDLGNYGVGMLVFNTMMLLPQVISQVFYPKIVELVSKNDYLGIKKIYISVNRILAIMMAFIVTIGYFILPYFIMWFMPEYKSGIKTAQILLIGIYPLTLVNVAANYFNATNNQKLYLTIQVISIVFNVILCLLFLDFSMSITSIAEASAICFTIYSVLMNFSFWMKFKKEVIFNEL